MTEGTYIHVHSLLNSTVWQKAPAMKVRAVNADILTIQSIAQYECKIIILIPHHKSQIRIQATINKCFRLKETHWAPARTLQLLLGCITDVTPTHPHTCTQLYTQAHQTYAHSNHAHVYSLRLHPRSPTPTPTPPPPPTPTPTPPHHILAHTHTHLVHTVKKHSTNMWGNSFPAEVFVVEWFLWTIEHTNRFPWTIAWLGDMVRARRCATTALQTKVSKLT